MNAPARSIQKKIIKSKDCASYSNEFVTACFQLTVVEHRTFSIVANHFKAKRFTRNKSGNLVFTIESSEYQKIFGCSPSQAANELSKASELIRNQEVVFPDPDSDDFNIKALDAISITVGRSVKPKKGIYSLIVNSEMEPYLGGDTYVLFRLAMIKGMKSEYSYRLLLSLLQHHWKTSNEMSSDGFYSVKMSINWMRSRYCLPKSMNRMPELRRGFLSRVAKEITENTPIKLLNDDLEPFYVELGGGTNKAPTHINFKYKVDDSFDESEELLPAINEY